MTLLFGITTNIILNLFIYLVITLVILFLNFLWIHSQDKDPGIAYIFALISWIVSFVSLNFIKGPENEIAYWLFIICAGLALGLMFIEPLFTFLSKVPGRIKQRKQRRKTEISVKTEVKVKKSFIQEL